MGKVLYLDLGMGAAGDMLAASLFDLLKEEERVEFLNTMNHAGLPNTVISAEQVQKSGIAGIHFRVQIHGEEELSSDVPTYEHDHEHIHGQEHDHNHGHMHGQEHDHDHGHMHGHDYEHEYKYEHAHEHDLENTQGYEHDHVNEHTNEHGCDHVHTHEHTHEHGHGHDHTHEHTHGHGHEHGHGHTHEHHSMEEILSRVNALALPEKVKQDIAAIYQDIAQAESRVHGRPVNEVHLHEVGMLDAIADIASVSLLLYKLAPDRIFASPITTGFGAVRCAHGILPVPAPATAMLLEGMPTRAGQVEGELCTPTGAALIRYFADNFGQAPEMVPLRTGYGMGSKEFTRLNCIRTTLGLITESGRTNYEATKDRNTQKDIEDAADRNIQTDFEIAANINTQTDFDTTTGENIRPEFDTTAGETDEIIELSCTVDDMTGEEIGFAVEELLRGGALDVWTTAVQMKKNRPGTIITVLCSEELRSTMIHLMFRHTSSIGVRETLHRRYILNRQSGEMETAYGSVRMKTVSGYGAARSKAEYEDLASIARSNGLSLREVREACR